MSHGFSDHKCFLNAVEYHKLSRGKSKYWHSVVTLVGSTFVIPLLCFKTVAYPYWITRPIKDHTKSIIDMKAF